jgi:hypothetical protein
MLHGRPKEVLTADAIPRTQSLRGERDGVGPQGWMDRRSALKLDESSINVVRAHFVDLVRKRIIAAGSRAQDFPVVHRELMAARRRLSLRKSLESTDEFDRRLSGESKSVVGLALRIASAKPVYRV